MLCAIVLFAASPADARGLDEIRLSKSSGKTTIEIELGCAMRYSGHSTAEGGAEVRIAMTTGQDCRLALQGTWSELRRPAGARLANLIEVEFERGSGDEAFITLHFDSTVSVDVRSTSNPYLLTAIVDTSNAILVSRPPPLPAPQQSIESPPAQAPTGSRSPGRQVQTPLSATRNRFVIRVAVLSDTDTATFDELKQFDRAVVYTNEVVVGERRWAELRLGFFDTEAEASQALGRLGAKYSGAWITVANPAEQTAAHERPYRWPDANAGSHRNETQLASVAGTRSEPTLTPAEIDAMLIKAKGAMLSRSFEDSIRIYTRLLEEPAGEHRQQARELLGVAREKNGQPAHARAEYEAWLDEFPDAAEKRRVEQRLAAITVSVVPAKSVTAAAESAERSPTWEFDAAVSQYYLRGVNMADDNSAGAEPRDDSIAQSAVLSQAYLFARRRGERFDLTGRANLAYLYDLVEDGSGDQGLVSYLYIDVTDTHSEFSGRLGRQRQPTSGALGSFDGAHASYRLRPELTINVTAGFPIDSPRFLATGDHYFYGGSIDLDNLLGDWDFSFFANRQTVDGIADRQAVGAEVQYFKDGLNIVGLLDYDASYNVLNTGLVTANWRINDRLTLYGRYRGGAAPFLTTRNAIIGQPVNTVRELRPLYSEGQIRRLARNRTAEERSGSAGLSAALTPRLRFKTDFAYSEYSATVASGGVDAVPASGLQYSWGGQLIGAGYGKPSQVLMLGYRHDETQSIDTDTVWFDVRHPIGDKLRIQSRLSVSNRVANQNPAGDIDQWTVNPVLRLLYTGRSRYRLELEVGGQWSNREFPDALLPPLTTENEVERSDYFVQLGYTLDFQ